MTEKRFTVKDDVGMLDVACANIFDNGEFIGTVPLFDAEKFVDLLNEQHETIERLNQQLRIFSDGLKAEIRETKEVFEDYSECVDEKKQLKEENEQLKTQIKIFEAFLEGNNLDIEWYEFCTRDECAFDGEYIDENEISCKDCLYLGCDF